MGSRLVSMRYRRELDHVPMYGDGTGDQPDRRSGARQLLWVRSDAPGCEGVWASISGDREGREIRQDCSGAVAMTRLNYR